MDPLQQVFSGGRVSLCALASIIFQCLNSRLCVVVVPQAVSPGVRELAATHDLVVTEDALEELAVASGGSLWDEVDAIGVFARMSPHGKARVIRAMQRRGHNVLMCGDGGNDVGALKQADVGLALLSGYDGAAEPAPHAFRALPWCHALCCRCADMVSCVLFDRCRYGNANTTGEAGGASATTSNAGLLVDGSADGQAAVVAARDAATKSSEEELNKQNKILRLRAQKAAKKIKAALAAKRKEFTAKAQGEWLQEELEARRQRGESTGIMAHAYAMKTVMGRMKAELKREQLRLQKLHGNVFDKKSGKDAAASPTDLSSLLSAAQEADGGLAVVRPGDASIAAPFTSRSPSVRSVVDLIRQGRCTLLSSLQQQQIMMLECMISAYVVCCGYRGRVLQPLSPACAWSGAVLSVGLTWCFGCCPSQVCVECTVSGRCTQFGAPNDGIELVDHDRKHCLLVLQARGPHASGAAASVTLPPRHHR